MATPKDEKYRIAYRATGKIDLPDPVNEKAIHLYAYEVPLDEILKITGLTLEQWDALLLDKDAQKRLKWKRGRRARVAEAKKDPKTTEEYAMRSIKELWKLGKSAKTVKEKIAAFSATARVAKQLPATAIEPPQIDKEAQAKLDKIAEKLKEHNEDKDTSNE